MLARGLEEVRDFEDVAGDLKVAVAVHGVRGSSGKERRSGGLVSRTAARVTGGRNARVGAGNKQPSRGGLRGGRPERYGLNSRNSNNSYSEHGQHRGTRRCGSR
ncbi:hypothetical protein ALMP_03160 [Streptomyces sp. A012304]|nr:hypothetical protein ALMP_03160 [Streptomyces sp. A012304]